MRNFVRDLFTRPRRAELLAVIAAQSAMCHRQHKCIEELHAKHLQMHALMIRMNLAIAVLQEEVEQNGGDDSDVRAMMGERPAVH